MVNALGEAVEVVDVQGRATVPPTDRYAIYQQIAPQLLPRDDHSPTNGVRTYGVTYRSAHALADGTLHRYTLRSSIWQRSAVGWQMSFHQSTPTEPYEPS